MKSQNMLPIIASNDVTNPLEGNAKFLREGSATFSTNAPNGVSSPNLRNLVLGQFRADHAAPVDRADGADRAASGLSAFSRKDKKHILDAHAKLSGQRFCRHFAGCVGLSDAPHLLIGQFSEYMTFAEPLWQCGLGKSNSSNATTSRMAISQNLVSHVVSIASCSKVGWIHARRSIARVQDIQTGRDRPLHEGVGDPMCGMVGTDASVLRNGERDGEETVTAAATSCPTLPQPAAVGLLDFAPESANIPLSHRRDTAKGGDRHAQLLP